MRNHSFWRLVLHTCIGFDAERSLAYNWGNIRSDAGAEATAAEKKNQVNLEHITLRGKQATDASYNVGPTRKYNILL